ncbi:MAG: DUF4445 domain-containing protein [Anaerolineaceae bacterium]|nr:DUF4445 domain-containing protein [Anaerolineaceae bacterium]
MKKQYQVEIQPIGLRIKIEEGKTFLTGAQEAGAGISALCGGEGWCGKCRINILSGDVSPMTDAEIETLSDDDKESGVRLACQACPAGDVKINVPPEVLTTLQRLQVEGQDLAVEVQPVVRVVDIQLAVPTVHDLRSDVLRVRDALAGKGYPDVQIEFPLLNEFSRKLRENHWQVRAVLRENEVIAVLSPQQRMLGLAVDIGTTKMAGYLVDLESGETLAKGGVTNPQVPYGEDVVSRIGYVNEHADGGKVLQLRLVERINELTANLCERVSASMEQVVDSVFVGNTAIHHLFLGIPVQQLGEAPYVASVSDPVNVHAGHLGLRFAAGAYVYMPPNIAGYVGADHVSMLLATETVRIAREEGKTVVSLDIGTNTEISLAHGSRLLSCSCASGPAFEGAHISAGMRATPGAIERVQLDGVVHIQTIENARPVGICGSGILDAVAEMHKHQIIDPNGQIRPDAHGVVIDGRRRSFQLVSAEETGNGHAIFITRKDVNEIQLAKAAIRAGVEVLLQEAGITHEEIDLFIIAGAFGTYLDRANAVAIGMFPELPEAHYQQVGNAAGMGAKLLLLSSAKRDEVKTLIDGDEYVELTAHPNFTNTYVDALIF